MAQATYPITATGGSNPFQSASLYVGDLDPSVTEANLFETFNTVGPVASIRVCRDSQTRASLGYAYVNFHTTADADRALDTMNFEKIKGKECRIMWSQRDPTLRNNNKGNVFVKNLHEEINNKTLYDTFSLFGNILSCKVVTDPETGKSKGYGYVHYTLAENAQKAIAGVHGLLIQGTQVTAELFRPRERRIAMSEWTNVYLKFIPASWSRDKLIQQMEADAGGKVTNFKIWDKPDMGTSACLNFATHEAARRLVEKYRGSKPIPPEAMASAITPSRSGAANQSGADASGGAAAAVDGDSKEADGGAENKTEEDDAGSEAEEKEASALREARDDGRPIQSLYVARAMKRKERDNFLKYRKKRIPTSRPGAYHCNLYVKNLDKEKMTSDALKSLFGDYGTITSARVMLDPRTKRSRGFGFVCFSKKEEATNALNKMNNAIIHGKKLYVNRAMRKQQRAVHLQRMRDRQQRPPYPQQYAGRPDERMPYAAPSYPTMPATAPYAGMHPGYHPAFAAQQPHFAGMNFRMPFGAPQHPMIGRMPFPLAPMVNVHQRAPFHAVSGGVSMPAQPASTAQVPAASARTGLQQPSVGQSVGGSQAQAIVGYQSHSVNQVAPAPQQVSQSTAPMQSASQAAAATGMTSVASQLSAPVRETQPLTPQMLKDAKPAERKRLIGERLFPKIQEVEPRLAGKITGMLLEMDNTELLILLENRKQLMKKINEALSVLKDHQMRQSANNQAGTDSVIGRASAGNTGSVKVAQSGSQANIQS